jgi:hypothetical protein
MNPARFNGEVFPTPPPAADPGLHEGHTAPIHRQDARNRVGDGHAVGLMKELQAPRSLRSWLDQLVERRAIRAALGSVALSDPKRS